MKINSLLFLSALGAQALVVPEDSVFESLQIQHNTQDRVVQGLSWDSVKSKGKVQDNLVKIKTGAKHAVDYASSRVDDAASKLYEKMLDVESWTGSMMMTDRDHPERPPHDGPPHDGPPHHGEPPHHGPAPPVRPPHHGPPNQTVYELISGSKYTTKLAKLIDEFPDLVSALNGTKANFTVFAPTDEAFEKIPEHHPKPSKEELLALLSYHVSPHFYPAGRVLATHTIPTLLDGEGLPGDDPKQRLSVHIGFKGLTVNFYSRVVAIDIFGTNGVIHGVDSIFVPPPRAAKIIELLPSEFSTFELALHKTGLWEHYNSTDHPSGTLFAPSNFAFAKLGPKINAFLFSKYGQKYLKALILYHTVPGHVVYSDAYYKDGEKEHSKGCGHGRKGPKKGLYHIDVPTALEDHNLAIDIARYGGLIDMKVNAFSHVVIQDGISSDGVVQVVGDVLIPPKKLNNVGKGLKSRVPGWMMWNRAGRDEMTLEEFKERMAPLM